MKYAINSPNVPDEHGPYSQGTTAGRLVFASGQLPYDPADDTRIIDGDIKEKTNRTIGIIETILAEVDCSLEDVAHVTVYLRHLSDLEDMNEAYAERFRRPCPGRAVVEVSDLPLGSLIEMDCIACR